MNEVFAITESSGMYFSEGFWVTQLKNCVVFDTLSEAKSYARKWGVSHVADYITVLE
jgi:hypothetical protein